MNHGNTEKTRRQDVADDLLLTDVLDALEMVGCQFWACKGPTLRPIPMTTCVACQIIARLRRRLDLPIRQGIEGSFALSEATRKRELREATGGSQ